MNKLNDTIEIYRQQGFFSSIGKVASEIADKIIEKSQSSYFGDILNIENEPLYEQIVLSALFLRDENRLPEALDMFERSKAVINEQNISFDKKSYMDFLNDEVSSIKKEMQ